MSDPLNKQKLGFGTAPVFFTAISTILGAILFLRFGFAVGTLGFWGVIMIILLGHLVTIPTALALSEIATNQKVEGGGEYYIISRSFGLNIGATIGIALFMSQAISVAFYVIAFTEAFSPLFDWLKSSWGIALPRQVISLPAMGLLSLLIIRKGANMGVQTLYIVVGILFVSLLLFFLGDTEYASEHPFNLFNQTFSNSDQFFLVFAICFPAFTGMTAGVGLSGDLRNPSRSIPLGTTLGTISGMIVYLLVAWKLSQSASPQDLQNDQLIMSRIAIYGALIIPIGLAASTISSAIGSVMVAPRTLQALGMDRSFPLGRINRYVSKGESNTNEPKNATLITCLIAFFFVAIGDVNFVAEIISMFFMVTYGSICLISFLYHFGADPSYRPSFRSKWYISLLGFIMCFWMMYEMNAFYTVMSIGIMVAIYAYVSNYHKERSGMEFIFKGAIFQLNRWLHVFLQKSRQKDKGEKWRPSAICISETSFEQEKPFRFLNWIAYKYGFGTYLHYIPGYYSQQTQQLATEVLNDLLAEHAEKENHVYIDTIISPSYTSAIAQTIQLPSISGMENNMVIFEFSKSKPDHLTHITENYPLVRAGGFDTCIFAHSDKEIRIKSGIHLWVQSLDITNFNLMVMLSYIILSHKDWKKSTIKIFQVCTDEEQEAVRKETEDLVSKGRLQISLKNVEMISSAKNHDLKALVKEKSAHAGLVMIGFNEAQIKQYAHDLFTGYEEIGDLLFVNAFKKRELY